MTRITIGQYYPADSVVHRLDARVKLTAMLFYITSLFFISHFSGYLAAALFIAAVIFLSRVPVRMILRGLRVILFILVFAVLMNVFLTPGERVVFSFHIIRITQEGLIIAGKMALRLTLLIMGSSLLTLTTSPIQLTDALEYLLNPLKRIKVPAHEIAMMMTIALRFIPTLAEEMEKIIKAQKARGADFDTGGLIKKSRSLIPVLVPLFVSSFRRAYELADAMDARCYRGDVNRTKMKVMRISRLDYYAAVYIAAYGASLVVTQWLLF